VVERRVVHRSDVTLTPYASARRIDTDALRAFIERAYAGAGWRMDEVDTGAVIATGEAARKENASAIVALFSGQAGKFVCATAGHHLEAILAAHGSGAVARSRDAATPLVLNVDIGGGTTKYSVCRDGEVTETAAVDLGARVSGWTAEDMAERILAVAEGRNVEGSLWLTEPLGSAGPFPAVVFSGGVGEYINGNEDRDFGDLGLALGRAIAAREKPFAVIPAAESIRATCIGASQYTVQVSGDTLFITDPALLPVRDLAAVAVRPSAPDAAAIAREVRAGIERLDREDGRFALAVRWRHGPAYPQLVELARGIAEGTRGVLRDGRPLVVVIDADVAGIVGMLLKNEHGVRSPLLCVDQIALSDLDFIDVGQFVPGRGVVPVVVKSLVFPER
jgi:ethanolamine utilization protein EutA